MADRTVIIIAHRLSTVKDADVIAVFNQGKIIDSGTHEDLLKTSRTYSNLVRKQLSWHHHQEGAGDEGVIIRASEGTEAEEELEEE